MEAAARDTTGASLAERDAAVLRLVVLCAAELREVEAAAELREVDWPAELRVVLWEALLREVLAAEPREVD